jgi:hypothetical protein
MGPLARIKCQGLMAYKCYCDTQPEDYLKKHDTWLITVKGTETNISVKNNQLQSYAAKETLNYSGIKKQQPKLLNYPLSKPQSATTSFTSCFQSGPISIHKNYTA